MINTNIGPISTLDSLVSLMLLIMISSMPTVVQPLSHFDEQLMQQLIDDPRAQVKTVYTSYAGITTAKISSFVSLFSSSLVILIIFRSAVGLLTSYHRIIFGLSVADALGSMAIFLSTWLMPKEMIYKQFETAVLGNARTCTAQGFILVNSIVMTFGFNTVLCIYYASIIRFKVSEERFKRCVEPFLFGLIMICSLCITIPLIFLDLISPSPLDYSCTGTGYPYWCNLGRGGDTSTTSEYELCPSRGNKQAVAFGLRICLIVLYLICSFTIFSSMFIICWTVYVQERTLKRYMNMRADHMRQKSRTEAKQNESEESDVDQKIHTSNQLRAETKIVLFQAIGYLGTFILCQLFPFVNLLLVVRQDVTVFQYFHVVLRPLQGLFNFLIFMGHKVHNRRRADNTLTRWQAFVKVFTSANEEEPTLFLGNMNLVVKRGEDDNEILDISFSEVKDSNFHESSPGSHHTIGPIDTKSRKSVNFDLPEDYSVRETSSNKNDTSNTSVGLSYGESSPEDIRDDNFIDNNQEDALSAGQSCAVNSSTSGLSSWYSRFTWKSNVSFAVSSFGTTDKSGS